MSEVKEENERLKMMLERVEKDYHSLQLHFFDILQGETSKKVVQDSGTSPDEVEEPKLVSLCLGTSPREPKKDRVICNSSKPKENEDLEANLTLGLDSRSPLSIDLVSDLSPMNSTEELKEAEARGTCSSSTNKSVRAKDGGDEISEQTLTKRARVCVRARCDTPTVSVDVKNYIINACCHPNSILGGFYHSIVFMVYVILFLCLIQVVLCLSNRCMMDASGGNMDRR